MRPPAIGLILAIAAACGGDEQDKRDTTRVIYEEDINAKDTTPPPPPSPIGRMRLSGTLPQGGNCTVTPYRGDPEMAYQIVYETLNPPRRALMEVGHATRRFAPVNLQIVGTQNNVTQREQETIFAGFSAAGAVTVGTRTYSSEGSVTANERSPLGITDGADMIEIAKQLLLLCAAPAGVR